MTPAPRKTIARRRFLRILGNTALGLTATTAEARYIEPNWVDVTRHTVFLPDLPLSMDGLLIAHLTDIHHGPVTPETTITDAIHRAAAAKPDLVALTGDFVHSKPIDAERLAPLLAPLAAARYGMIACLGNHDYGDPKHTGDAVARALTEKAGVPFLRNRNVRIAPGLYIAGIDDTLRGHPDVAAAFRGIPHGAATIYLTHNPMGVWKATTRSCLALSGHTHGGQVCIPGVAPHFPPGMAGFPLIAGWGIFDRAQLYISRGVGMGMLPLRFRCRPEVALFTLRRGEQSPQTVPGLAGRAIGKVERVTRTAIHRLV